MQHGSDINSVCTYCGTGCDITAQVEHNKIIKIYAQNEKKYQDMIQEKYNIDNIFKKNEEIIENKQEQKNDMQIVVYKNSTLKRIINKILNFLHLR
jgi:predicted molibdopterin-dependent oxidoreductase YjgC